MWSDKNYMEYLKYKEIKLDNDTYKKEPPNTKEVIGKINEIIRYINDKEYEEYEEWRKR
jgi:hypothetical protein